MEGEQVTIRTEAAYTRTPPRATTSSWSRHANELAEWTMRLLVNRTDAWGAYRPLDRRGDGSKSYTAKGTLGSVILRRHYRARFPHDVIGLHSTAPDNTCKWGAIEIDQHGDGAAPDLAQRNESFAIAKADTLVGLGFNPLLTDSNGCGGFHFRVIFNEQVASEKVFHFLQWLIRDWASFGLDGKPETFPKQRNLDGLQYGNWLRIPGRHHTRKHWSRVYDLGTREWIEGEPAIRYMFALKGDKA
jgi:hypothetical protein